MDLTSNSDQRQKKAARERVANASEESRALARDAIFDRALQDALLEGVPETLGNNT